MFTVFLFLKLHNKNAKRGILEDLEIKISFAAQPVGGIFKKFLKVKISPLKTSAPLTGLSVKKSCLKITHGLLSTKLCDSSPSFIFSIYYHQVIDLIESKIYKPLVPNSKKKPPQNLYIIFFENKGVKFINVAHILRDPDVVKSLPSSSVKFPMPMVTYKHTPPISAKFFKFKMFVNNLDLDLFLINPDSLPCKCNNSPLADGPHKHKVTSDIYESLKLMF